MQNDPKEFGLVKKKSKLEMMIKQDERTGSTGMEKKKLSDFQPEIEQAAYSIQNCQNLDVNVDVTLVPQRQ